MQFQIPQFIDTESKVVGFFTLKQFLYVAAAGGLIFLFFYILETWLWIIVSAILLALGLSLALIKYNGQPLPKIIWLAISFLWKPRVYTWQREAEPSIAVSQGRTLREFLAEMPKVKKLVLDLVTTKVPLSGREKSLHKKIDGQFQVFRKISGAQEVARRVDYR